MLKSGVFLVNGSVPEHPQSVAAIIGSAENFTNLFIMSSVKDV